MFLGAVNTEGEIKRKKYIAEMLISVIDSVGPKNVVQVITDNAANYKGVGLIIEQKYDHIFWTPCVVHTLNLALKNICDAKDNDAENAGLMWIKDTMEVAFMIKNYIMNHGMRLSMFNEFSKLKFLAIADTRFASHIIMLKRFLVLKESLVLMVVGDKWSTYREDDVDKARSIKDKLLDDFWWDNVKYIVDFAEPIYSMLRPADTNKPCLHLIYEMWDSMIEKVKDRIYRHERKQPVEESAFYDTIYAILYYSQQWLSEVPNRVAPHEDIEQWWGLHGQRTPELKSLALKLLGQSASSSSCERNWSTYGFIDSVTRNRLTPPRAKDLVFVHSNMRLLSRKSDDYMKGPTQMWDVGADNHETFYGAGILEHADLSLDEPEFERI
ncbi:uncharacterized protein [Miscanthus floridulus]|uniref:uncharacterized protein n=1 Tax=Miscanthus floridulus TaxID=154761 RepID=UPI00345B2DF8